MLWTGHDEVLRGIRTTARQYRNWNVISINHYTQYELGLIESFSNGQTAMIAVGFRFRVRPKYRGRSTVLRFYMIVTKIKMGGGCLKNGPRGKKIMKRFLIDKRAPSSGHGSSNSYYRVLEQLFKMATANIDIILTFKNYVAFE